MIVFDLVCSGGHRFEAWFRDSATFEERNAAGHVDCPVCGDRTIGKALMAPNVTTSRQREAGGQARARELAGRLMTEMRTLRRKVETNCEYVGSAFPEQARRLHYGEVEPSDAKGIYGEATEDEAAALDDEGIDVRRIPWVPLHDD